LHRVDHQQHRIGRLRAFPGGADHRPVEPPPRFENARSVGQDDLRGGAVLCLGQRDAEQAHPGGLRLGAGDRDLLPDQRVDERGLARIGRADHGGDAASGFGLSHPNRSMKASAAAVSASCLLVPVASTSPTLCTETRTVNLAAWSGPDLSASSYCGGARRLPAAHSCSALLGCLVCPARPSTASCQIERTSSRVGPKPRSRKLAPSSASITSPRILSLSVPPSPRACLPSRICGGRPISRAMQAHISRLTSTLSRCESLPSGAISRS